LPVSQHRLLAAAALVLCACSAPNDHRTLTVAAAANLNPVFDEIAWAFIAKTGVKVVNSYASTAQLARQIESGAPFDVFAAADTEHVDTLVRSGKLIGDTRAVYARGKLVLWVPNPDRVPVTALKDLARDEVGFIAVASPNVAPYGKAAVQVLRAAGLWSRVERKVSYATNISLAREYAASGNADAAFTAYSLVIRSGGRVIPVDASQHDPLDQALAVVSDSRNALSAREFAAYVVAGPGADILQRYGYEVRR
jgi:molybdate transport system substrate-binding protein